MKQSDGKGGATGPGATLEVGGWEEATQGDAPIFFFFSHDLGGMIFERKMSFCSLKINKKNIFLLFFSTYPIIVNNV